MTLNTALKISKDSPQVKQHLTWLGIFLGIGVFLVLNSFWLSKSRWAGPWFRIFSQGVSAVFFANAVLEVVRFFRGNPIQVEGRSLIMREDEMIFQEPEGQFEIWLYCKVPFGRYQGTIKIFRGGTAEIHVIYLHSQKSWMRTRSRKDTSPIVWRLPKTALKQSGQCLVRFHLVPNPNEINLYADEVEFVTLMVKSV